MSYVVYSIKGGVGKTTLSVQISQMLEFTYVTNDSHSSAHNLMPEEKGFLVSSEEYEEIPFDENVVYDFGGFKDKRINEVIKQVNKVIIPTLTSIVDVQATLATLKDVMDMGKNDNGKIDLTILGGADDKVTFKNEIGKEWSSNVVNDDKGNKLYTEWSNTTGDTTVTVKVEQPISDGITN